MAEEGEKVVKIDAKLFVEIEKFISEGRNNLKYSSKKQFVDIAVLDLLNKERNINQNNVNIKKRKK
jgi:hypothetical protein